MTKHLAICGKYKSIQHVDSEEIPNVVDLLHNFGTSEHERLPTQGSMTRANLCEQVLRIAVSGSLSFSFVENDEFVALLQHAYPHCVPPNRRSLAERLKDNAEREKERLKAELERLDSKISLAMDCWTSRNHYGYMGKPPTTL